MKTGITGFIQTLITLQKEDFKYMGKRGETKDFKGKPIHQ